MQGYARVLDRQIIKTYNTINNQHDANWTNNPNNPIMRGVRQPFSLGGMGLRSVEMVSPIAYYASSVAAIRLITEEIDPTLRMLVQELGSKPIPPHNPPIPPDQEEGDEIEALFGSESPATQGESPPSSIHTQPAPLNMQAGQHGERERARMKRSRETQILTHTLHLTPCWRGSVRRRVKHGHATTRSQRY